MKLHENMENSCIFSKEVITDCNSAYNKTELEHGVVYIFSFLQYVWLCVDLASISSALPSTFCCVQKKFQ